MANEVGEVLQCAFALSAYAQRLVAAAAELLDGALQTNAERIGRETKHLADRASDASAIGMHIVDRSQLAGDLGVETMREGTWYLVQDIEGCGRDYISG